MYELVDAAAKREKDISLLHLHPPLCFLCFRRVQLPHRGHDFQAADRLLPLHHLLPHRHHRLLLMDVILAGPQVGKGCLPYRVIHLVVDHGCWVDLDLDAPPYCPAA